MSAKLAELMAEQKNIPAIQAFIRHARLLNKDIQQAIIDLFNQGTNVRVIDIISDQPNGGGNDLSQKGTKFSIVIAPEIMPGKTDNNQAITGILKQKLFKNKSNHIKSERYETDKS